MRDNEDPNENNNEGYTFGRIPFLYQNDIVQRDGSMVHVRKKDRENRPHGHPRSCSQS